MIKKEIKINLKSFIIWISVLIGMFLIVYICYPFIMTDEAMQSLDELVKVFPEEMLKAFNMDITSINSAYGWLKSEGFTFVLMIIGLYSSLLGANILLKEESEKTIEYLGCLPVKRSKILLSKVITSITYIISMTLLLLIFNFICLSLSDTFELKEFLLISISPILLALPMFSINLFISTFMHKTKKTAGICIGLVFFFYMLSVISALSEKVEFLKYFTLYTLSDIRNIVANLCINKINIIISLLITITFVILSLIRYNKKELI